MAKDNDKPETDWRAQLTDEQFRVARLGGTEPAFSGQYWDNKVDGSYRCICCGAELFSSQSKFDSGCGWPSFTAPAAKDQVGERSDTSHGMRRIEVICTSCDAHLGHVFPDGPGPSGQRYCINSASLSFNEQSDDGDDE